MAQDHNDIYSIVERLRMLEEGLTPTTVKHGLNKQQKSVDQLGAMFKPKTVAVLTAKTDPKNPMAGKLVGGSESVERDDAVLEADMSEDILEKVKRSFTDFIKHVEDEIKDSDIKEKNHGDSDLKTKDKKDRDLIAKEAIPDSLEEDPTQTEPEPTPTGDAYPVTPESKSVKTVAVGNDMICEIHGNEVDGFEIRRGTRSLPTRFKDLTQAEMALEMYMAHMKKQDESQDYLDEE